NKTSCYSYTLQSKKLGTYSSWGSRIYSQPFLDGGLGSYTTISTSNTYWTNTNGGTTQGPLNRCGVWATTSVASMDAIGRSMIVNIKESKTYYIGVGGDNYINLELD